SWKEHTRLIRINPELVAALRAIDRPETLQVDSAGEDRRRLPVGPGGHGCPELLRHDGYQIEQPQTGERYDPGARVRQVGAMEGDGVNRSADHQRGPGGEAEVGVDD